MHCRLQFREEARLPCTQHTCSKCVQFKQNTLCLGYCGQGPREEPTKGRHKNSSPLTVSTTPLKRALSGSAFNPGTPTPVPMMTSTRSLCLNFCSLYSANTSTPKPCPPLTNMLNIIDRFCTKTIVGFKNKNKSHFPS